VLGPNASPVSEVVPDLSPDFIGPPAAQDNSGVPMSSNQTLSPIQIASLVDLLKDAESDAGGEPGDASAEASGEGGGQGEGGGSQARRGGRIYNHENAENNDTIQHALRLSRDGSYIPNKGVDDLHAALYIAHMLFGGGMHGR
jgi:hypothetical protein